jgi:hypothetical protein
MIFFPMRSEVEVTNLTMDLVVMLVVLALVLSSDEEDGDSSAPNSF